MRLAKFVLLGVVLAGLATGAFAVTIQPSTEPVTVTGVIAAISLEKQAVTLQVPAATDSARAFVTFFVNEKTVIVKNGQRAKLANLAVKDECVAKCVRTTTGLVALAVNAKTPVPTPVVVYGKISEIDLETTTFKLELPATADAVARVMLFVVDRGTIIRKDGKEVGFGDLAVGDLASVKFLPPAPSTLPVIVPIRAIAVEARTPSVPVTHIIGKLVRIDAGGTIAVLPNNASAPLLYQVTNLTKIVKFKPAPFEALLVGDVVDVAFYRTAELTNRIPVALCVNVLPNGYKGVIIAVDLVNGAIVCQQLPGTSATPVTAIRFKVVPETVIMKNGVRVTLRELRPKDLVEVKYFHFTDANVAGAICAKTP